MDVNSSDDGPNTEMVGALIADAGLFIGNPGYINIPTIGNIRRQNDGDDTGNKNYSAKFYFKVYRRQANGTENLLATSLKTQDIQPYARPAGGYVYQSFNAIAILNDGEWAETDRIVIKYYADTANADTNKVAYEFQFGGATPIRTNLPVPVATVTTNADKVKVLDTEENYNGANVEEVLAEIGETRLVSGWDLYNPDTMGDISWDDATRTFSVAVKSGQTSYHFWVNSKKITHTTTQSVIIPDTTAYYYIVFDENGDLVVKTTASVGLIDFYINAITGLVYWNATIQEGLPSNEMHGKVMSPATHISEHLTFGARYEKGGLSITGLANGSTTYTNITAGAIWDEDIRHAIDAEIAHGWMWREGTDGAWVTDESDSNVSYNNGDAFDVWNEYTGTTWQLTPGGTTSDFWIVFYMAMPDMTGGIIRKIIGQNAYASRGDARDAIEAELSKLKTDGLPSPEYVFLYATIVKRDGTLIDDGNGNTYYDLRTSNGSGGSVVTEVPDLVAFDNYVIVKQESDFPGAALGKIDLAVNTLYIINGTVTTANTLVIPNGASIRGNSVSTDVLIHTGSNALIESLNASFALRNLTLSSNGVVFDCSDDSFEKNLYIYDCVIANASSVGEMFGHKSVNILTTLLQENTQGIKLTNSESVVITSSKFLKNTGKSVEFYFDNTKDEPGDGGGTPLVATDLFFSEYNEGSSNNK